MLCVQTSLLDLKEHASSLASSGLKKDSKLKSLEIALEQKKEECHKLESQFKRVRLAEQTCWLLARLHPVCGILPRPRAGSGGTRC